DLRVQVAPVRVHAGRPGADGGFLRGGAGRQGCLHAHGRAGGGVVPPPVGEPLAGGHPLDPLLEDSGHVLRRGARVEMHGLCRVATGLESDHRLETEGEMSTTVTSYKNFVGGDWVDAVEGETMEVLNPATGEVIAEVPRGGEADVERAVDAARKVLPDWLEKTPKHPMELP